LPGRYPAPAAAALFDSLAKAAVVATAAVDGGLPGPVVPGREQRLIDLGAPSAAITGTGLISLSMFVPQAAFGAMTGLWSLRGTGRHTPSPHVTVSVLVNGKLVASEATSDDGIFAITRTIDESTLARDNTVEVIAEQRDDNGPCSAAAHPIDVQI